MTSSYKSLLSPLLTFLFLIFIVSVVSAEVMETNPNLSCKLTDASAQIKTTTDVNDNTIAEVDFQMWWETGTAPADEIKSIKGYFFYDNDNVDFLEEDYTLQNWDGTVTITVYPNTPNNDYDKVELEFVDNSPSEFPQEAATTYITLRFQLTACKSEYFTTDLVLDAGTNGMQVDDGGPTWYYAENLDNGTLSVTNYYADYIINDATYTCGVLGDRITVYVLCDNNFRTRATTHLITYDDEKLDYVSGSWTIYEPDIWYMYSYCAESNDSLRVLLNASFDTYNARNFDTYPGYGDTLYSLQFDVIANPPWDGVANGTVLDFVDDSSKTYVYFSDGMYYYCSSLTEAWNYEDGTIAMDDYTADIKVDFDCEDCDKYLSLSDDEATAAVKLEANFASGGASDRIEAVFDLTDDWGTADFNTPYNGFTFTEASVDYSYLAISQYNSATLDCTEGEYDSLGLVTVEWDNDGFSPNYANRYVDLCPIDEASTYESQIVDVTGNVPTEYGDGLTFTCGQAEVLMGEFSTTSGSSQSVFVSHDLRLRNNITVDTFYVEVTANNSWCIKCVICESGVTAHRISSSVYEISSTNSSFNEGANGDSYTKLATIWYGMPSCMYNKSYGMTPTLSDGYIEDNTSNSHYVAYSANGVGGKCNNTSGGCGATIPIQCGSGGGGMSRIVDEFETPGNGILPNNFALYPNRPNPFNPRTVIAYDVPVATHVTIEVFNILGQSITTLVDEEKAPGRYEVIWNGHDAGGSRVASGIYLYNMRAGDFVESKKMMLMK
ncbi:MAG: hypothetical protein CVT49_05310 [candidate division Zixibacteria bacterium HGW-Zixibacteria-1]|nr:MAG: hypothetical protein CVT49_05310 [candidate division Zixibacteria bacterium HGW-Zixibacteria-1]